MGLERRSGPTAAFKKRRGPDDVRAEYDFSTGVRGKYVTRLARGTNIVVLDPDVADVFRTSKAVNDALREHLRKRPLRKVRR